MAESGSHILVFPYPAPGHMIPLLDLTHHLATRGLSITILTTPKNLPFLTSLLSAHPLSITTLLLPFPPHPAIPASIENAKDMPFSAINHFMVAFGGLRDPILNWFRNHPSPPVVILSDLFLGWTNGLAEELGIRRYVFSPSGALGLSVINSLWRDFPKRERDDSTEDDCLVSFPNISENTSFPWWQLSSIYRGYIEGDATWEFIKDGFRANMASYGVVVNSFTELDRVYFDHMVAESGHDRVFAVGPLLPTAKDVVGRGGVASSDVLLWLDTCEPGTVVFVSFGSQFVLTNEQMEGVALGLERSGVRFVWAVKGPTGGHAAGDYGKVPDGFEERVEGRGVVVRGWVPQVAILGHDSVVALLTHCGWNSVLEALMAGVLMLTWPMSADNFSNAKLLHELGIGIKACEGGENVPDPVEFAELLRKSVGEETRVERDRVAEFAVAAKEAVGEGGSSWKDLDRLVLNMSQ